MGDSALTVIRNGRTHFAHEQLVQTHWFNAPLQLAKTTSALDQSDRPRDAAPIALQLQHLDVVFLSTDGFWDNGTSVRGSQESAGASRAAYVVYADASVFPAELEQLCRICLAEHDESKPEQLDDLVRKLAEACCYLAAQSARSDRRTPFQIGAEAAGKPDWTGGKIDDVSVAIGLAIDDPSLDAATIV